MAKNRMNDKTKIAIIGTAGIPARYGGFETMAHRLVEQLSKEYHLTVYCSGKYYSKNERLKTYEGADLKYIPLNANGAQSIPYDIISIISALFYADILLVLGVSGAIILPLVKLLFPRKKIVISIDGIEWKREKWQGFIKKFLRFSEAIAVKYSDADITDNEAIKQYTASRYQTVSNLIEYGADHANCQNIAKEMRDQYTFLGSSYAFKVCRIEPENNLEMILDAFSKVPDKTLVVIGNWNKSLFGKNLKDNYSSYKNLYLLDPIYDQKKLDIIRSNAFVYIHGHSAGGTNPSLVEAMYLGLPIFAFGVSFNKETTEYKADYFNDSLELIKLLKEVRMPRLASMRNDMKEIAARRYQWNRIAEKYDMLFKHGLKHRRKQPVRSALAMLPAELLQETQVLHLASHKLYFES
jgi:glycosyltransferase involved in cell wall biosynthesis